MMKDVHPLFRLARSVAAVLIASLLLVPLATSEPIYPAAQWESIASAERAGWSSAKLAAARDYASTIDTAAVMIITGGKVLAEWGETARKFNVHSIRKSLLSALYGIHVGEGHIDLSATMGELGIDDNEPSLTDSEKEATVHDLLKARSGIYHPALYETDGMKQARPARWSHAPGTFWYYNNWDFNVLGTIFERLTKTNLFREFKARIADPLGMQDYSIEDGQYVTGRDSVYPAYPFRLSARDLARFGLLYLRQGAWRGTRIMPAGWVRASTTAYSDAGRSGGYGYLWWVAVQGRHLPGVVLPDGSYSARGAGGHYILIIPDDDLIVVHRVNTDVRTNRVTAAEFGRLVHLILGARMPSATSSGS